MTTDVAVIGAGSWGTVLADLLARKGLNVSIWAYEAEVADAIATYHTNPLYLPHASLAPSLRASHDLLDVVSGASLICSVVPSHISRQVFTTIAPHVAPGTVLVCATKGIDTVTLQLMGDVARDTIPHATFVALSGPSFAEEVLAGQPTAIVAASNDAAAAVQVQRLFSTPTFRVYSNDDVCGVTLGGSIKNTIAIAAGIVEGLQLGNNPRAALLTRGLAELARLGEAMGGRTETFAGLAGMGDLILTCTGALSRNRQLGVALAHGTTLDEYHHAHRTVVEGVNTAKAAVRLAERHNVDMPITRQVAAVLFDNVSPRESIQLLMDRTLKAERWT
ncbi:MAG TPA: NAD(P)H-dependent glycerol-3-phosphate dehydrogenase [Gemmatimonadales bacterium]|jgi:glycerol-3-phosphate dehydrogenase (NAD(P)+)